MWESFINPTLSSNISLMDSGCELLQLSFPHHVYSLPNAPVNSMSEHHVETLVSRPQGR
jgi:hypothetical protein